MKYALNTIKINYEPYLDKFLVVYPKKGNAIRILSENSFKILKLMDKGVDLKEIVNKIAEETDFSKKKVEKDIFSFIYELESIEAIKIRTIGSKSQLVNLTKKQSSDHLYRPFKVHLAITNKCNLKCKHCYNVDSGRELSKKQWFKILDYLSEWGVLKLQISGGEPLCNQNFKEIISYASSKSFSLMLFTNGAMIQKKSLAKFISNNFSTVQINIDGTEKYHDEFRGVPGSFSRTKNGIKLLLKEKAKIILGMSIDSNNVDMMEEAYSFAIANKIKNIRFSPIALEGRGSSYKFGVEEYKEIWKKINNFMDSKKENKNVSILSPKVSKLDIPRNYRLCSAGKTLLHISANGDVFACPLLTYNELRIGNYFEHDLKNLWDYAKGFKELRNIRIPDCENCKENCVYWCRGINYGLTHKLDSKPPFCLIK